MPAIHATPFVRGRATGKITRNGSNPAGGLLVLSQDELGSLAVPPAGLVVVDGAPLSHPMIRVFGLGIPTVLVSEAQGRYLVDGMEMVLDGDTGLVASPAQAGAGKPVPEPSAPPASAPVLTADGEAIALRASVADVQHAREAVRCGAAAIGLVRSELLFSPDGRRPDAAFYEHALAALCEAARPLPVNIRLLDIAADKRPPWLGELPGMHGALGLQGVRLYAVAPVRDVLLAEVEAIGRIAPHFDLSVTMPYVVQAHELLRWRREIEAHLPVRVPLGSMAETPAAALDIARFLAVADFVAIGCNDLMQCLFAADRDIAQVSYLLDPYSPVLFRFLRQVAASAGADLTRVQLCGLLSQMPGTLPLLVGLGFRAFSVEPRMIPVLAQRITRLSLREAAGLARAACDAPDADAVRRLLGLPASQLWSAPP